MTALAQQIESYLLKAGGWVSSETLCAAFNLRDDRPLRQVGDVPGLCTEFAVSGNKGFCHVALAPTPEWLRFKHRIKKHGIRELCRIRDLDRRRHNVTRHVANLTFERDTGQALLLGVM